MDSGTDQVRFWGRGCGASIPDVVEWRCGICWSTSTSAAVEVEESFERFLRLFFVCMCDYISVIIIIIIIKKMKRKKEKKKKTNPLSSQFAIPSP